MIDINYSLRIAYQTALSGIAGVPVFYNMVPPMVSPNNYIMFRTITNTDAGTINTSDVDTQITVEIQTYESGLNSGLTADMVAREVFNRIYPNQRSSLVIDGAQVVKTRLLNDITQAPVTQANRTYVSRFITFGHNIYMRSDIS